MGWSLFTTRRLKMTSVQSHTARVRALIAIAIVLMLALPVLAQVAPSKAVASQIASIQQVKRDLTPAQKKMDSTLAFATVGQKTPAAISSFASAMSPLSKAQSGKIVVDVRGNVTDALLQQIKKAGGDVIYSSPRWHTVRAAIPLQNMEAVAAQSDVARVSSRVWAHTNVGAVTSQGYVAHRAKQVVEQQGYKGAGVNVGVLSDSATAAEIAALQATGDLPLTSYALPGQNGSGSNEGTAMMEIVYDMAPGSTPIFATAFTSDASFADNIIALQGAGCKVIVDDVTYFEEPVFQDGIIAQAVNQVVTNGSIYFSSAANSGSKKDGTSGTWEGDFKDGGAVSGVIGTSEGGVGRFHDFGGQVYDRFTATPSGYVFLQWSDPWGNACDDYDLFVTNSTGTTIKAFSADAQTCSGSDPVEGLYYSNGATNDRIYIVQYSGATRALHLDTERSYISINTNGAAFGHNAGNSTVSMAATYYGSAHLGVVPFTGMANPVETFSSDGPRKIFYNPNGNAITPGNVLFSTNGGTTLQKPDLTAADGVFTKTPGFLPFFGTSAAAPHAAGIAALVVSARPGYTPAQIKQAMKASALDNEAVCWDPNGGWGIAMANGAVNYALSH
jgi:hypothetical protein